MKVLIARWAGHKDYKNNDLHFGTDNLENFFRLKNTPAF